MYDDYFILSNILDAELKQCLDEGRDCAAYGQLIEGLQKLPAGEAREEIAQAIYNGLMRLPMAPEIEGEPSEWEQILSKLPDKPEKAQAPLSTTERMDRVLGAWQGRCAGCLLGKPFEGAMAADISAYYGIPLGAYVPLSYYRAREQESVPFLQNQAHLSIDRQRGMPVDDDINYTVLALMLLEKNGHDFSRLDWADHFVRNLPPEATFTAERIAYRNLIDLIFPPATALHQNPYREWIGAQIRADMYGYVNPGDPLTAANMAWRDASITHIKSGIYGAMWVAASLALAFIMPAQRAVREALCVIPPESRFYRALDDAFRDSDGGMTYEAALAKIRARWQEGNAHHWCHAVSNAVIVANAILYGESDLERTLSMAVLPGFDTDCNGATAGSILGMSLGAAALDEKWIAPLKDHLAVSLAGVEDLRLTQLAQRTVEQIGG